MKTIGVVFNPLAGKNRKKKNRKEKLEKILGDRGMVRETKSMEDLDAVAKEFYEQDVNILALSGGDGTNHCVLTAFSKVYKDKPLPIIALLRGGTMNLLETSLKMKGHPEDRLKKLVNMVEAGQVNLINHTLLTVNDRCGYIFGNGLIANFMKEYYKGERPSFKKAAKVFFKALISSILCNGFMKKLFEPIKATVEINGEKLPVESFIALMAATEKECGLGFKPFYRAREKQGNLHFVAFNMTPFETIKSLHKIRTGKKICSKKVFDVVTDNVLIQTYKPYYYTLDGEMLNSTKTLKLGAGPTIKIVKI